MDDAFVGELIYLFSFGLGGLAFALGPFVIVRLLSARKTRNVADKTGQYIECGMDPIGDAWIRYSAVYYLYALVFIAFAVDVLYLIPVALVYDRQFAIRDFVEVQRLLLDALGIRRLVAVAGPSMGGLQALEWAIAYPDRIARMISVVSVGSLGPWTVMMPGHAATEAVRLDPRWDGGDYYGKAEPTEGLVLALKILTTIARCPAWADATYGRRPADPAAPPESTPADRFLIEAELDALLDLTAMTQPGIREGAGGG